MAIERINKDLVVILKIKREVVEIPQSVGVRQGNNMAPVLFLFLMSAFAETLESKWKNAGIGVCTVRPAVGSKLAAGEGQVCGHLPKEYLSPHLTTLEILQCLYVNDGAFIFSPRKDMAHGLERVFFPPPCFFNSKLPLSITHSSEGCDADKKLTYSNNVLTKTDRQCENTARQREREKARYDDLEEIKPIAVADGQVTCCRHFKYLGSYISFGLIDDYDIEQ